jgi:sulfur dioxygenase
MLVFRQLFDPPSSTYTYLLADGANGAAVIIDPVFEQVRRDAALIEELGLRLAYALETHVHADHVTGACLLKQRTGCRIALAANSGAEGADRYLVQDDVVAFGDRNLQVRQTPGHTNGCLTYVLDDRSMAFTGDCLFVRGTGRTDFQQGDPHAMYRSIHEQIFTLPDSCLLYPAHDYRGLTVTSVREERRFNPRLGGEIGEGDFTGYMKNLRLAHPKKLDVAVPANLKCGRRRDNRGAELGGAQIFFCRDLGNRSARARGTRAGGPDPRRARARRVHRPTRAPSRRDPDPARRPRRPRRGIGARSPDRCRLPRRQPVRASHRHSARSRL